MDRVNDVMLFLRIFDAGSISAAARSLDLSVSLASQRLKRLERELGVSLFNRSTRRLLPTPEALMLAEQGRPLIEDLEALTGSLREASRGVSGVLRLTTSSTFGRLYISPLLPEFLALHPRLKLSVDLTDEKQDIVAGGFDLAIRIGALQDSSLVARPIAVNRRVLCAAPSYLARRGRPAHPRELAEHDCLVLVSRDGRRDTWHLKDGHGRDHAVRVAGPVESNQGELLRDASVAGLGIALHSSWHIAEDLRAGRLERVLPKFAEAPTKIHAVMPRRRMVPPRVRVFVDFLASRFGATPPWERD
jgi:DNA-binding transcriptional LysR family regulator